MESTGDQITISVTDTQPPPPPPTLSASSQFYGSFPFVLGLNFFVLLYLFELAFLRVKFKEERQSPFETHAGLMIISFVSLFVAALTLGVLFLAPKFLRSSMRDMHYNILGVTCFFFGFLPSLCILLVLCLPQNRVWGGYLVICVFFIIVVAGGMRFCVGKNDVSSLQPRQVTQEEKFPVNYSFMFLPLPIALGFILPNNLNWIKQSVYGVTFVTLFAYNTWFIVACMKLAKKQKADNLEARQVAQEDTSETVI